MDFHLNSEYDFWEQKSMGQVSGKISCKELEIGEFSMDAISVKSEVWENNTLSVGLSGVVATTESYWFHIQDGHKVEKISGTGISAASAFTGEEDMLMIEVEFLRKTAPWK